MTINKIYCFTQNFLLYYSTHEQPYTNIYMDRESYRKRKLYLKRKRNLPNVVGKAGMSKLITHSHNNRQPC